ncbi:hypothetical protein BDQ17DRAFT_161585 [Cyathus striatus]|nr:hypothetical protein BDQ17DRAFT_161585 [Cyathus striatus]
MKYITISGITQHLFTTDLPRYLSPLPPAPGPVLGTLSTLVLLPKQLDFEIIEGLGRIEEDVVDQLARKRRLRRMRCGRLLDVMMAPRGMQLRLHICF